MIQEKLVISDTNILLDLISVDMLEDFFSLPCDFSTRCRLICDYLEENVKNVFWSGEIDVWGNIVFAIPKKVLKFHNSFRHIETNCKKIILVRFNRTSCIIFYSSLLYTYGKARKLA